MIERRLENLLALDYPQDKVEIVVASDASDGPHRRARRGDRRREPRVRLLRLPARRQGRGAEPRRARDATARCSRSRTRTPSGPWPPCAASSATSPTPRSPTSAASCGSRTPTAANREGAYWRYELKLREAESRLGSVTGGNGSIYAVRRSDYVEVDPRFGHDLALPYLMVQRGRRAVYEPEAVAFEKPTPDIETEYRRKVRMFEHCWLIVLRGRMLRGVDPLYRARARLASASALRQRPAPLGRARRERRPRSASTASTSSRLPARSAFSPPRPPARGFRATTRSSPGRRSWRSPGTFASACRPSGRNRRERGERDRDDDVWRELACPRDRTRLEVRGETLVCEQGHEYPYVDGIPVLVVDDEIARRSRGTGRARSRSSAAAPRCRRRWRARRSTPTSPS